MKILKRVGKILGCMLSAFINIVGSISTVATIFKIFITDDTFLISFVIVLLGGILALLNNYFMTEIYKQDSKKEIE
jgi:uncharacterized membrane protein